MKTAKEEWEGKEATKKRFEENKRRGVIAKCITSNSCESAVSSLITHKFQGVARKVLN